MSLESHTPQRALLWPELIEQIATAVSEPSRLYLVGGVVRDALRGYPIHDIDLATPDDGLQVARQIANSLNGAYYPVDPERQTGRAILSAPEGHVVVDVASFRGPDLLADLTGRDFTINAMAVQLDELEMLIDPLGGEADLFDRKLLQQCNPRSISSDPIRAFRAVRMSLQFRLRMPPETREAARAVATALIDETGALYQPERARDELFKILGGNNPSGALRLMDSLGLLPALTPFPPLDSTELDALFTLVEITNALLTVISPKRSDDTAADILLGVAVIVLDRFRTQLQEHVSQELANERSRAQLLLLASFTPPTAASGQAWAERLRLSNAERKMLDQVFASREIQFPPQGWWQDRDRAIYRYYRKFGESGVEAVLLELARYLADHRFTIDAKEWGKLLDEVVSPLLEGFFRRYQEVVSPPPLLNGNDLTELLGLQPSPSVGKILAILIEEQAAGTIRDKKQALRLAKRLLEQYNQ